MTKCFYRNAQTYFAYQKLHLSRVAMFRTWLNGIEHSHLLIIITYTGLEFL